MPDLVLKDVSYCYRNTAMPAVAHVDCTFETGKLYAIVGPSGSGKSTLLSMMAGLDMPTEGDVRFGNERLSELNLDRYRRESIAMIFQMFQLFPLLTVLENVCYPMELCGVRPVDAMPRARVLLENMGISAEQMKRFPSHLSGGEQQRVAIARSLATGAKTLLADEPTGNLDEANTRNVIDILAKLAHDEGYCVIVVTHDMEVAEAADIVFKMKRGTLIWATNI